MKFAAFGVGGGPFEQALEVAQTCESIGYNGIFYGYHHSPDLRQAVGIKPGQSQTSERGGAGSSGSQWPRIAALAARTKTIEFGTAIFLLPFVHPLIVAEDIATLDQISKGRIILGAGPGYNKADFDMFGIPVSNRVSLFEEGVEVILRAWTEDHFNFVGKRYTIKNASVHPKPYTKPHPPLWIGPWSIEGYKRSARQADGVVTDPVMDIAGLKECIGVYRELCKARGKKPYVALMRETLIAHNKEEALQRFGASVTGTLQYYGWSGVMDKAREPWLRQVKSYEEITFNMVNFDDRFLWGSPDEVTAQLRHLNNELGGIDYLLPTFPGGSGPDGAKHVMEAVRLFGEKVMPKFK